MGSGGACVCERNERGLRHGLGPAITRTEPCAPSRRCLMPCSSDLASVCARSDLFTESLPRMGAEAHAQGLPLPRTRTCRPEAARAEQVTWDVGEIAWEIEHCVATDASREFAWNFMTDVRNWDDPPARFELAGAFETGARGTTLLPEQSPTQWRVHDVKPRLSYSIVTELEGAVLSFEWRFDPISDDRAKLTQRITLSGEDASRHIEGIRAAFESTLAAGMEKIATSIAAAHAHRRSED